MSNCTKERFLNDVKDHSIEIYMDDGLYRHIVFSEGGSAIYRIALITWPGCLCIRSDCGTFVFSRIEDMFDFFSGDGINPQYWAEKVLARDRDGIEQFCSKTFKEAVKSHFEDFDFDEELGKKIWEELEDQVLRFSHNQHEALEATHDFSSKYYEGDFFQDFWGELSTDAYTFSYLWCCYAIQWGIQKYQEHLNQANKELATNT